AKSVQIFGSVASSRSRLNVAMRNPRHARCAAAATGGGSPNRLSGGRNQSSAATRATGGSVRVPPNNGICLSKAARALSHTNEQGLRAPCLIFDLELLDVGGLGPGGLDPLPHLRHRQNGTGIAREKRRKLHVVGHEAGDDGCVH